MPYEHKENSGSLFINDRKELETHSDWNGSALIDGKEYWVNAWKHPGDRPRLSLAFKLKEPKKEEAPSQNNDSEDDVPW